MTTQNMHKFIEHNHRSNVVFGELRTPEDKPVLTKSDLERADRCFYRLEDGTQFVITSVDASSSPNFKPNWMI